jgi:hypothetical protein
LQFEDHDVRIKSVNGSLKSGIEAVCRLLKFLKDKKIPICIAELETIPSMTNTLVCDIAGNAKVIRKNKLSTFEGTDFDEFLEDNGVDTLIVGGFNMIACVRATVNDARARGYEVWSSPNILFSSNIRLDDLKTRLRANEQLQFYRDNTSCFETVDEMQETIRRQGLATGLLLRNMASHTKIHSVQKYERNC